MSIVSLTGGKRGVSDCVCLGRGSVPCEPPVFFFKKFRVWGIEPVCLAQQLRKAGSLLPKTTVKWRNGSCTVSSRDCQWSDCHWYTLFADHRTSNIRTYFSWIETPWTRNNSYIPRTFSAFSLRVMIVLEITQPTPKQKNPIPLHFAKQIKHTVVNSK